VLGPEAACAVLGDDFLAPHRLVYHVAHLLGVGARLVPVVKPHPHVVCACDLDRVVDLVEEVEDRHLFLGIKEGDRVNPHVPSPLGDGLYLLVALPPGVVVDGPARRVGRRHGGLRRLDGVQCCPVATVTGVHDYLQLVELLYELQPEVAQAGDVLVPLGCAHADAVSHVVRQLHDPDPEMVEQLEDLHVVLEVGGVLEARYHRHLALLLSPHYVICAHRLRQGRREQVDLVDQVGETPGSPPEALGYVLPPVPHGVVHGGHTGPPDVPDVSLPGLLILSQHLEDELPRPLVDQPRGQTRTDHFPLELVHPVVPDRRPRLQGVYYYRALVEFLRPLLLGGAQLDYPRSHHQIIPLERMTSAPNTARATATT